VTKNTSDLSFSEVWFDPILSVNESLEKMPLMYEKDQDFGKSPTSQSCKLQKIDSSSLFDTNYTDSLKLDQESPMENDPSKLGVRFDPTSKRTYTKTKLATSMSAVKLTERKIQQLGKNGKTIETVMVKTNEEGNAVQRISPD